jgi:hypothetical protein
MSDSDVLYLAIVLLVAIIAVLSPPGPGTPLRSPVPSR